MAEGQSVTPPPVSSKFSFSFDDYKPTDWVKPTPPPDTRRQFRQLPRLANLIRERILPGIRDNDYEYTPVKNDEIRLLSILPGKKEDPIECIMVVKILKEVERKYRALSYYWGTERARFPVTIYDPVRKPLKKNADFADVVNQVKPKKTFFIRYNLYTAIQALRREREYVLIWIDAICINQGPEGEEEKQQQVSRMAQIYNSAFSVCIWLGEGDERTKIAMDFIKEILTLKDFDQLVDDPNSKDKWAALTELMRSRWFSRRWVVQEVALARNASLHCGSQVVHWDDFCDATCLFMTKLDRIRTLFAADPDELGDVEALGANVLVTAISNLFRKSADGDIQQHLVGIETLVSSLLFFETSNPHDTVYSLLSLARDTPQQHRTNYRGPLDPNSRAVFPISVDYQTNAIEMFMDFTRLCIETSMSLDIICRHWAPTVFDKATKVIQLPSWIPNISDSPFGTPHDTLQGRRSGDSLVGCPYRDSRKTYNASRGTSAIVEFGRNGQVYDGTLKVKGFHLASIIKVSGRIAKGVIHAEWLQLGGWRTPENPSKDRVPDRLWRTLVADRSPDGGNPPGWYHRACLHCLTDQSIIDVNGDLTVSHKTRKPGSDIMMQFLKRAESVCWNRQFFLAKEKDMDHLSPVDATEELFGLAPKECAVGDTICILAGCTVPVILRKRTVLVDQPYYQVIGECYVHGRMDGEAMAGLDAQALNKNLEWFLLK